VGGLPEVIKHGETGILVPSQNEAQLICALEALIQDGLRRRMLGERGRRHIMAHFSLRRMVTEYQELYESLVHRNGA
jgi:glycosyltransferase involved in cell wall biosynthesis